jgi:hypothetical protein
VCPQFLVDVYLPYVPFLSAVVVVLDSVVPLFTLLLFAVGVGVAIPLGIRRKVRDEVFDLQQHGQLCCNESLYYPLKLSLFAVIRTSGHFRRRWNPS